MNSESKKSWIIAIASSLSGFGTMLATVYTGGSPEMGFYAMMVVLFVVAVGLYWYYSTPMSATEVNTDR